MVDGAGDLVIRYKEDGQPVEIVYPEEGECSLAGSPSGVFKAAPAPNAARLFQNWMHSREADKALVDRAVRIRRIARPWRSPASAVADIKLMKEDRTVEKIGDEINALRADFQGVMRLTAELCHAPRRRGPSPRRLQ